MKLQLRLYQAVWSINNVDDYVDVYVKSEKGYKCRVVNNMHTICIQNVDYVACMTYQMGLYDKMLIGME